MGTIKLCLMLLAFAALSGCSNKINSALGLDRRGPDEFTVISYPEPVVPKDYSQLPVPK